MDRLPLEILLSIFQRLSFRSLAICLTVSKEWQEIILQLRIYKSIHISSPQQLQRFINGADILLNINNRYRPIYFFVHHIHIYFPIDQYTHLLPTILRTYPNIRSIATVSPSTTYLSSDKTPYPSFFIKTPSPRTFNRLPYWYKNAYINKITSARADHRTLQSLEFYLPSFTTYSSSSSSSLLNSNIYLQSVGSIKSRKKRSFSSTSSNINSMDIDYRSNVLMIPNLQHLVSLKLAFKLPKYYERQFEFEIDERSLESIHQSSPQLQQLHLLYFYFNISEDYNPSLVSKNSARSLVELKINGSVFDSDCFDYLSLKYPNLNDFEFNYSYNDSHNYSYQYIKIPLYNLITNFKFLQSLSLRSSCSNNKSIYWPHNELIEWINKHPHQLKSIDYPDLLCTKLVDTSSSSLVLASRSSSSSSLSSLSSASSSSTSVSTDNNQLIKSKSKMIDSPITTTPTNNSDQSTSSAEHNQLNINLINGLFFNQLVSLSVRAKEFNKSVSDYFLYYNSDTLSLVLSTSIKEFNISGLKGIRKKNIYLFDYFEFFPKLQDFKAEYVHLIDESEDLHSTLMAPNENEEDDDILHMLMLGLNKSHDKKYKLKTLNINNCGLKYKNGFTGLLSRFYHLHELILHHIDYKHFCWFGDQGLPSNINELYINIYHLSIYYISIAHIGIYPWNHGFYSGKKVTKIQLNELSTNKTVIYNQINNRATNGRSRRSHRSLDSYQSNSNFIIELNCNYVDHLVFY